MPVPPCVRGWGDYARDMMSQFPLRTMWLLLLLSCGLAACATNQGAGGTSARAEEEGQAVSFEEGCEDETSLLAVCGESECGLFQCREVREALGVGRVVLARGGAVVLPGAQAGVQRYWGSAQQLPQDTRPVFIIPWRHKPPLLPSQQQMLEEAARQWARPHERHHIFPRMFREWFRLRGIDIDEFVILLEVEKHRSIHRGANGGPWNAAWYKFINEHLVTPVSKEEIYRYAGQLIYEFELFGPVVPYWK